MILILDGAAIIVTRHVQNSRLVTVGARFKGDLERLFPKARVKLTPNKDFPFHAFMPGYVMGKMFDQYLANMAYTVFPLERDESGPREWFEDHLMDRWRDAGAADHRAAFDEWSRLRASLMEAEHGG